MAGNRVALALGSGGARGYAHIGVIDELRHRGYEIVGIAGSSMGALTVVSGALRETRWDGEALRRRRLRAGDQAGFPLGWVHDVVWTPERDLSAPVTPGFSVAGYAAPTMSVHAYSPPLTAMSYY